MFNEAVRLLDRCYGRPAGFGPFYRWSTLVRVVLEPRAHVRRKDRDWTWVDDSQLRSARETAAASLAGVVELLRAHKPPARMDTALFHLAQWWIEDELREQESPDAWQRPVESLRSELRAVHGVGPGLRDRILLFVGGLPAFPIDRAVIRIAGRHGWIEPDADADEWQSFFSRGAANCSVSLVDLAHWFAETGRDFCGPKPYCDCCPLRSLLPAGRGPVRLADDGE
jgi:endonuclease-3 related protein